LGFIFRFEIFVSEYMKYFKLYDIYMVFCFVNIDYNIT